MSEQSVQIGVTKAFIDADPTTIVLVPRTRMLGADGTYSYVDGTPRPSQRFKLSLLSYDQRPTVTVNGIERLIDYHLIGLPDALIEVGDYWMENTTRYEVVGFSDGFGYEIKAFVIRTVPRDEVP